MPVLYCADCVYIKTPPASVLFHSSNTPSGVSFLEKTLASRYGVERLGFSLQQTKEAAIRTATTKVLIVERRVPGKGTGPMGGSI
jgi:hypothetical protein